MLHELSIENLGVIASARLTLGRGLTVVTGETGAGKTMVLTGLALVTGGKADPALVRGGSEAAVAEAVVDVPEGSEAWAALAEADVRRNDDGTVTVTRTLGAATRSRTVVGGRQVPQSLLADCAAEVVTVHGQAEQARLRGAAKQRETLDRHAGAAHLALLEEYRGAWAALAAAREALEAMRNGAAAERAVMGQLRDDLAAIEAVGPRLGEDEELAAEARVLENAEAVRQGAAMAREVLAGDAEGTVAALLEAARKGLAEAGRHDASLADLEARVAEHAYGLADVAAELGRYLSALDADPARLEQVQERRSALAGLARRLGRDLPGVLDYAREAAARLEALDNWDESLAAREAEVVGAQAALDSLAARLSQGRREAAVRLAQSVNAELAQLAMPQAAFAVEVEPVEAGPFGADSVTMTLAAHPGASPRPVADAASGGELSRIMLAIEVSLAQGNVAPGHTFVFDEVDAGVGGKAAIDVGRRLAELARTQQVLVVTHLAQVAAFADHHVVVTKGTTGEVTTSQVVEVTGEDRVLEVARLLSGQEDSSTARAHALELIEGSTLAR